MYGLDCAERRHPGNQLSFMLHELVFSGYQLQHRIRTRSHGIRMVVKLYNQTSQLRYGCNPVEYFLYRCFSNETFIKNQYSSTNSVP